MRRSIAIAVLLSVCFPSFGQVYNRNYKQAVIIVLLLFFNIIGLFIFIAYHLQLAYPDLVSDLVMQKISMDGADNKIKLEEAIRQIFDQKSYFLFFFKVFFLGIWSYSVSHAYFDVKKL